MPQVPSFVASHHSGSYKMLKIEKLYFLFSLTYFFLVANNIVKASGKFEIQTFQYVSEDTEAQKDSTLSQIRLVCSDNIMVRIPGS